MRGLALGPGWESIPSTTQWAQDRHQDQTKLGPSRASPYPMGAEAPGLSQERWDPTAERPRLAPARPAFGRLNPPEHWRHPGGSNADSARNHPGNKTGQSAVFAQASCRSAGSPRDWSHQIPWQNSTQPPVDQPRNVAVPRRSIQQAGIEPSRENLINSFCQRFQRQTAFKRTKKR